MRGCPAAGGDVAGTMPPLHLPRLLSLCVLLGHTGETVAKAVPSRGTLEVLVRVQVFDNSDLSLLQDAAVQVFGNQSILASSRTGSDGIVMLSFQYQPGTWVIVTASKVAYVTNSALWHSSQIPLYASVSLYLLPQRPATLIFYDDVIQVLLGSPGSRNQPWVQFQRRGAHLPNNSSYTELSAVLTAARSQQEIAGFPYMLAYENNSTGESGSWLDLTAVAAANVQLFTHNETAIQVSDPIHISIPLPADTPLKSATSIPVWMYNSSTGFWVRKGSGYIKKDGVHMTWSFVAPHLGYWVAAMPSATGVGLSPGGLRDITTYHTIFLLAILGSMVLLVLILLCLLLYYCRRRCLKPRQQHRKMHASSTLEGSKRDQGTSMSRLNLISDGHMDTASTTGDKDAIKSEFSSSLDFQGSREEFFQHVPPHKLRPSKGSIGDSATRRGESFPMKVTRSTDTNSLDPPLLRDDYTRSCNLMDEKHSNGHPRHSAKDNQGYSSDPPSPPPFSNHYQGHKQDNKPPEYSVSQSADHLTRPTSLNTQPSQFIFCGSIDQMKENMYRSMVPTLVIPAHYMQLSSDFSAADQTAEQLQKKNAEDGQGAHRLNTQQQHHVQQHEPSPPGEDPEGRNWAPNPPSGPVRIPVLFNDSTMAQMNGELQALTEKKLLELGVKQHPRAWFISLDGRANPHVRHSYIDLGNERGARAFSESIPIHPLSDVETPAPPRKPKFEKPKGIKAYSKLASLHDASPGAGDSRSETCSPDDSSLTPLLDKAQEPRGATIPRRCRSRVSSSRSSNSENRLDSVTSPEDDMDADDKDDDDENKKSPWQRREERPLMVFNVKK